MPISTPTSNFKRKQMTLRDKAWWVLRNRKSATVNSLLLSLSDGAQKTAASNLRKYLNALADAGILKRIGAPQTGEVGYMLAVDCGIKTPVHRPALKQVYCPNTQSIYPLEAA